jgi:Mrp family chromosome partitioning ATPase/capsular polysaccharide biosynthesis protein
VLTYLQLHWLMILFCGLLLGGAGAYAAWELMASKFESTALLQVSSVPAALANQNNPNQARTDFVTYLKTTSALIKSDFVLNAALRDLRELPSIKAQKDPIKYLEEELLVNWQDGSEVIRITFKSHAPADAKKIVDAVQGAFMREVIEKDIKEKQGFLQKVEAAQIDMKRILNNKKEGLEKPPGNGKPSIVGNAATPAGKDPAIPAGPAQPGAAILPPILPAAGGAGDAQAAGGVPMPPMGQPAPAVPLPGMELGRIDPRILVARVGRLQEELERLPLLMSDGRRHLTLLQQKMDAIKKAPTSKRTMDSIEKDPDIVGQILKIKAARRTYDFRLGAAGDANSPGIRELKRVLDAEEAHLEELRKEKAETLESENRIRAANAVGAEMEEVIRTLQRQQEQYDTAKALLAQAERQLTDLPLPGDKIAEQKLYNPQYSDLDTTDGIYRRLVSQYYMTQMELNSPPRVRLLQPASNPAQKDVKKQIIGTVFAGLMGFAIMGLGAIAFETMTRRVSSLGDVKSASNLSVVGVIPCLPSEATGKDAVKRAAANESIDKLRTFVSQTWLARGATTVAVTSPLEEEGKAFTAFGLASSLAQSGYKTLLVDFDLRNPQLHTFAGIPNTNGVCELLRAEMAPQAAIQVLPSGLHMLPSGRWSDEARKNATGEKLETLLSRLKEPYDCVVLHGHALLTAAESVEVARRCEVVLVCALYRETTTPLLKRAAERVATMEIPYSGIVYVGATEREALC